MQSADQVSAVGKEGWFRLSRTLKMVVYGGMTCIFALGGAVVGSVTGAIKGQTTETGPLCGAGIGAVAGAVVSVELMESLIQGNVLSQIAMLASLLNGTIFCEWVSLAMLNAYQWQISTIEVNNGQEFSDLFDTGSNNKGMSPQAIEKLPEFDVQQQPTASDRSRETVSCSVCLQDFRDGEKGRRLPTCTHAFHKPCIDMWLRRHASCPICRRDV